MAPDEKENGLNFEKGKDGEVKLQRFGRYLLLDHLVDGGMAKICRARHLGEQGTKVVAIKMIQSQYSLDPSFKQMFLDEIKVTFGLSHPSIAQTYDYGFINGQLYTAIEYVDGKNLKQFLDRLKDRISMLGTDLEDIKGNEIIVEIFPNRPDMLSEQGFARAFSSFIGIKKERFFN